MRVATLVLGTRGDLELILLLGRELRHRGHDVVVATSSFFAPAVARAGLAWLPAGAGDRDGMQALLDDTTTSREERARRVIDGWFARELAHAEQAGHLRRLVAGADYFVSNLKLVLDREGGPSDPGSAILPGAVVTYDPPASLEALARFPPHPWQQRDILDLVALPPALFDPVGAWGTWGKRYQFTGFWTSPPRDVEPYEPPGPLAAFLAAGPPPVAITAGSMTAFDPHGFTARLVAALRSARLRAVLLPGWSEIPASPAPDLLHVAGEVPYRWLFERAACVVHHGSHGATAAALHAGRAAVVLPHIDCQETMGKALVWAGVGTAVLDPVTFEPATLAGALARACDDPHVHAAVAHWQARSTADPGIVHAADLVEAHHRRGHTD
jgi:UDP:flavonoid glycosyltransferase YjiC (YdhE family)